MDAGILRLWGQLCWGTVVAALFLTSPSDSRAEFVPDLVRRLDTDGLQAIEELERQWSAAEEFTHRTVFKEAAWKSIAGELPRVAATPTSREEFIAGRFSIVLPDKIREAYRHELRKLHEKGGGDLKLDLPRLAAEVLLIMHEVGPDLAKWMDARPRGVAISAEEALQVVFEKLGAYETRQRAVTRIRLLAALPPSLAQALGVDRARWERWLADREELSTMNRLARASAGALTQAIWPIAEVARRRDQLIAECQAEIERITRWFEKARSELEALRLFYDRILSIRTHDFGGTQEDCPTGPALRLRFAAVPPQQQRGFETPLEAELLLVLPQTSIRMVINADAWRKYVAEDVEEARSEAPSGVETCVVRELRTGMSITHITARLENGTLTFVLPEFRWITTTRLDFSAAGEIFRALRLEGLGPVRVLGVKLDRASGIPRAVRIEYEWQPPVPGTEGPAAPVRGELELDPSKLELDGIRDKLLEQWRLRLIDALMSKRQAFAQAFGSELVSISITEGGFEPGGPIGTVRVRGPPLGLVLEATLFIETDPQGRPRLALGRAPVPAETRSAIRAVVGEELRRAVAGTELARRLDEIAPRLSVLGLTYIPAPEHSIEGALQLPVHNGRPIRFSLRRGGFHIDMSDLRAALIRQALPEVVARLTGDFRDKIPKELSLLGVRFRVYLTGHDNEWRIVTLEATFDGSDILIEDIRVRRDGRVDLSRSRARGLEPLARHMLAAAGLSEAVRIVEATLSSGGFTISAALSLPIGSLAFEIVVPLSSRSVSKQELLRSVRAEIEALPGPISIAEVGTIHDVQVRVSFQDEALSIWLVGTIDVASVAHVPVRVRLLPSPIAVELDGDIKHLLLGALANLGLKFLTEHAPVSVGDLQIARTQPFTLQFDLGFDLWLFKVHADDVRLGVGGLEFPDMLAARVGAAIPLPAGFWLVEPGVTYRYRDDALGVIADLTWGNPEAARIVALRGTFVSDWRGLAFEHTGDLLLVRVLSLFRTWGRVDLRQARLEVEGRTADLLADIIRLTTNIVIDARVPELRGKAHLSLFGLRIADVNLHVGTFGIRAATYLNLLVGSLEASIQVGPQLKNWRIDAHGQLQVGGFTLAAARLLITHKIVRLQATVLGLDLVVIVPSPLDLRPSLILDIISSLFDFDIAAFFENLARGEIVINLTNSDGQGGDEGAGAPLGQGPDAPNLEEELDTWKEPSARPDGPGQKPHGQPRKLDRAGDEHPKPIDGKDPREGGKQFGPEVVDKLLNPQPPASVVRLPNVVRTRLAPFFAANPRPKAVLPEEFDVQLFMDASGRLQLVNYMTGEVKPVPCPLSVFLSCQDRVCYDYIDHPRRQPTPFERLLLRECQNFVDGYHALQDPVRLDFTVGKWRAPFVRYETKLLRPLPGPPPPVDLIREESLGPAPVMTKYRVLLQRADHDAYAVTLRSGPSITIPAVRDHVALWMLDQMFVAPDPSFPFAWVVKQNRIAVAHVPYEPEGGKPASIRVVAFDPSGWHSVGHITRVGTGAPEPRITKDCRRFWSAVSDSPRAPHPQGRRGGWIRLSADRWVWRDPPPSPPDALGAPTAEQPRRPPEFDPSFFDCSAPEHHGKIPPAGGWFAALAALLRAAAPPSLWVALNPNEADYDLPLVPLEPWTRWHDAVFDAAGRDGKARIYWGQEGHTRYAIVWTDEQITLIEQHGQRRPVARAIASGTFEKNWRALRPSVRRLPGGVPVTQEPDERAVSELFFLPGDRWRDYLLINPMAMFRQ